jgi:hypothetical protein
VALANIGSNRQFEGAFFVTIVVVVAMAGCTCALDHGGPCNFMGGTSPFRLPIQQRIGALGEPTLSLGAWRNKAEMPQHW